MAYPEQRYDGREADVIERLADSDADELWSLSTAERRHPRQGVQRRSEPARGDLCGGCP
ncbi:hypothetical protein Are01nite_39340 [Actinoplanes regularis]|nr:hypothetical protein Are01nite_39340 [Actinoplanes regularis]